MSLYHEADRISREMQVLSRSLQQVDTNLEAAWHDARASYDQAKQSVEAIAASVAETVNGDPSLKNKEQREAKISVALRSHSDYCTAYKEMLRMQSLARTCESSVEAKAQLRKADEMALKALGQQADMVSAQLHEAAQSRAVEAALRRLEAVKESRAPVHS